MLEIDKALPSRHSSISNLTFCTCPFYVKTALPNPMSASIHYTTLFAFMSALVHSFITKSAPAHLFITKSALVEDISKRLTLGIEKNCLFSRRLATLELAVSVGPSVGRSVT